MTYESIFFKRYKINPLNFISIGICLGLSIYFLTINPIEFESRGTIVFYSFGLYFFTLGFNYGALRNLNVWLVWFGLSILQVGVYYKHGLYDTDWPATNGLRNFWAFLIVFQFFRWTSLKMQKKEFVSVGRSKTDIIDNRKFTTWDWILNLPLTAFIFMFQII